jgi:hypothetical protein
MDVQEETWLTTGEAARIAARDNRTIRRWAQAGILTCRVSPGGWRQIALSSLLRAQPATNKPRRDGSPVAPPDDTIGQWAQVVDDWYGWRPPHTMATTALEELLVASREVNTAMARLEASVLQELRRRDAAHTGPSY